MSLLGKFGWGRRQAAEEAAQRRIAALQTALDHCNASVRRSAEGRRKVMGAIAALSLVLGIAAGVHHEPILHTARYVAANLGIYADDANAADQSAGALAQARAEAGDARAQLMLALRYYRARIETRDYKEALKWFHRAADRGDVAAPFYLGIMSAEGEGVPQDHAEAARWFRIAADRGNPEAQYNIGLAYATGIGVTPDDVSAHMWLNLAAASFPTSDAGKRSDAAHNRDAVARKMTPAQVAEAQRLASAWHAAAGVRTAAGEGAPR